MENDIEKPDVAHGNYSNGFYCSTGSGSVYAVGGHRTSPTFAAN
jgi:hypothetical protein